MKEKLQRRRNWKSRQVLDVETDDSVTKKIKLDLPDVNLQKYDTSNALVLPSDKRKTKIKASAAATIKQLSNKQRKKLEKVLDVKKKKRNRSELFEALAKVQATPEESKLYLSTSDMQTKGFKRNSLATPTPNDSFTNLKSVRGSGKKMNKFENTEPQSSTDSSSGSSDDESDFDESEIKDNNDSQSNVINPDIQEPNTSHAESTIENKSIKETATSNATISSPKPNCTPATYRPLNRTDEIQECRLKLPILAEEQVVMEAINENPVVIVCGETGSGKTTQVPQFLYEAGYSNGGLMIGVTEPRRVAAITMSERVGLEMNLSSDIVSYQIRYEGNTTDKTEIKFMTDGVLLKEMQTDFLLTKYSVLVLDEAHERSVFTDILIGLLSRVVFLRIKKNMPLKLVIMSATLKVEDFTSNKYLFKTPPAVVKVESRQYPVSIHFNKRTPDDYIAEAYRKVCKIHRQLPDGGILIFVTGQREVKILCNKLRRMFPIRNTRETSEEQEHEENKDCDKANTQKSFPAKIEMKESNTHIKASELDDTVIQKINLDDYSVAPMTEINDENEIDDSEEFLSDDDDEVDEHQLSKDNPEPPMYVLPLFSFLPTHKQAQVFKPPPEGCRLCVVATNVAETSITIPNVKYVVDTGKVKMRLYDRVTGVSTFRIMWASKASANQRAGRAGRMGAGHCYRLYSSAVFNDDFINFSQPELCRRPIDDVVLQLKEMNVDKVINFPFPTPVDGESIKASEKRLMSLGALEQPKSSGIKDKEQVSTIITQLGHAIACLPVAPRYGKMLALSNQHKLLPYVVAITAALSVPELLHETQTSFTADQENEEVHTDSKKWMEIRKAWAGKENSLKLGDVMVLLKAVGACEYVGCSQHYCEKHGIHYKSMIEIRKLRFQLTNAINLAIPSANLCIDPQMLPPSDLQAKLLRQIMLSGLPDNVAKKVSEYEVTGDKDLKRKWKKSYKSSNLEEPVFLHPTCVLFQQMPEFVVYQEIFETKKLYMKGITAIEPEWLLTFFPNQCAMSNPLPFPEPRFDQNSGTVKCHVTSTFGKFCWELPPAEVNFPEGLERMKWFARFFLNGEVYTKLAKYVDKLLIPPSTMTKSWSRLQPRTETFLNGLQRRNIYSKETLNQIWVKDSKYLLEEYTSWLPESFHLELSNIWPPV